MMLGKLLGDSKTVIQGADAQALSLAKSRLLFVAAAFMLGYLAITLRLIDLTLLRAPVEQVTQKASEETGAIALGKPLRGTILDRNGELMATSLKMASVYADASATDNAGKVASDLADILGADTKAGIEKKLASKKKFVWLARNITPKQQYAINLLGHPGIGFQEEDRRIYPGGPLTSHLLGYTDVDGKGIAGIEKAHDKQLAEGQEDLRLTVDLRIQHVLHRALNDAMGKFSAKAAIGMVMDVNTGEVIASVSLPDYDPNRIDTASDDQRFSRTSLGVFEMGSTIKLFTTAGALESGTASFGTVYDGVTPLKYGRFTITDYHGKKRNLTLPEVFIYSSNIGTARMAQGMGDGKLHDFFKQLGFFERVPVNLPERGSPMYPPAPWRDISTATVSFGHGMAISPLHLMRATSAVVNGGILIKPRFTQEEGASTSLEPQGERVLRPQTSEQMRKLMELVVAEGTGSNAYVEGYHVGGKTGTAEKSGAHGYNENALFSSFLGVFPIKNPRYAVLAILDEPKATKDTYGYATGGWVSAPVVAKVIAQMGPLYQIPPDLETGPGIEAEMGQYLKEAKWKEKSVASQGTR